MSEYSYNRVLAIEAARDADQSAWEAEAGMSHVIAYRKHRAPYPMGGSVHRLQAACACGGFATEIGDVSDIRERARKHLERYDRGDT